MGVNTRVGVAHRPVGPRRTCLENNGLTSTPVKTLSCLQCEEKGDACVLSKVTGNGI